MSKIIGRYNLLLSLCLRGGRCIILKIFEKQTRNPVTNGRYLRLGNYEVITNK